MKPLKLTATLPDNEDRLPPSIVVSTMAGKYFCTVWADGRITFNPEFEYSTDELTQVLDIEKQFFTIYNSIIEKDKFIEALQSENKELMKEITFGLNPVIERQETYYK